MGSSVSAKPVDEKVRFAGTFMFRLAKLHASMARAQVFWW